MSTRLRVGMGEPYGIRLRVAAGPDFDPMAVTGAVIKVTRPNSSTVITWTATVEEKIAESATVVHVFAPAGTDLNVEGVWRAWVQWTVPGQTPGPRSETTAFTVIPENAP